MKVLLVKDVKGLGKDGDVKDVSDGYARNFLLAKNFAIAATTKALRTHSEKVSAKERDDHLEKSVYSDLAQRLNGTKISFKDKVSEKGVYFASITARRIAQELQKKKLDVTERMIVLKSPIKEPSRQTVEINLPHGFKASVIIVAGSA